MTARPRQIVGLGGGGFSMEPENPLLDEYILSLSGAAKPHVCFIPTASFDADSYIYRFHKNLKKFTRKTSALKLTPPEKADIRAHLLAQDVIYVGGGNTMHLMKTWRAHGLDKILRECYEAGIILAGISAGSICWFEEALTDSIPGTLTRMPCLGFLSGSHCVHYDGEAMRRPFYQRAVCEGMPAGYAADDGVGLHYVNESLAQVVSSRPDARAYFVQCVGGKPVESEVVPHYLGGATTLVRRGASIDAAAIHDCHHRSVRELAAKDYSPEQVAAWTVRTLTPEVEARLLWELKHEFVLVLEIDGRIEGFAHMRTPPETAPLAYLQALYLTREGAGHGFGRKLLMMTEAEAKRRGLAGMRLHSSRTAFGFYQRLGYATSGPIDLHVVAGTAIERLPMSKAF